MTFVQYISQIGGLLGLWMGFSFISAIEILYWFTIRLPRNIWNLLWRFIFQQSNYYIVYLFVYQGIYEIHYNVSKFFKKDHLFYSITWLFLELTLSTVLIFFLVIIGSSGEKSIETLSSSCRLLKFVDAFSEKIRNRKSASMLGL